MKLPIMPDFFQYFANWISTFKTFLLANRAIYFCNKLLNPIKNSNIIEIFNIRLDDFGKNGKNIFFLNGHIFGTTGVVRK